MEKLVSSGQALRPVSSAERVMGWYAMTIAFPDLKLTDVLTPAAAEYFSEAPKAQCNHQMGDTLTYFITYTGQAIRENPVNQDAWMKRYTENSLGNIKAQVPLAIYQGEDDLAVFPAATTAYVKKACSTGATILYTMYKGTDHIRLSSRAKIDFLNWIVLVR